MKDVSFFYPFNTDIRWVHAKKLIHNYFSDNNNSNKNFAIFSIKNLNESLRNIYDFQSYYQIFYRRLEKPVNKVFIIDDISIKTSDSNERKLKNNDLWTSILKFRQIYEEFKKFFENNDIPFYLRDSYSLDLQILAWVENILKDKEITTTYELFDSLYQDFTSLSSVSLIFRKIFQTEKYDYELIPTNFKAIKRYLFILKNNFGINNNKVLKL
ncbi:MAG: hypothetical protein ACTSU2_04580, partial [Promethearchaeota archaeon]